MQFNKVLNAFLLIFIIVFIETTLTARTYQKGKSASLRIFPLNQRQTQGHGRSSSAIGSGFDKTPATASSTSTNGRKGRDLMKKFLLFKSLFTQQKSEPNSNVIIITQPATAGTTTPSTTGTTGTITTTAGTSSLPPDANTGRGNEQPDINETNAVLVDNFENDKPELIKQMKPNKLRLKKLNKKLITKQKQQQRLRSQLNKRKRFTKRIPYTHKETYFKEAQIPNVVNSTKKLQEKTITSNNDNNSNNNANSNNNNNNHVASSGILNLNMNMRLQNLMNAFRKQTPILYNY